MVDAKKNFFGVSDKDIKFFEEQERQEQERLAQKEQEQREREFAEMRSVERSVLLNQFKLNDLKRPNLISVPKVYSGAASLFMFAAVMFAFDIMVNPIIDIACDKDVYFDKEYFQDQWNPIQDGKFSPSSAWYRNLAFVVVGLCMAYWFYKIQKDEFGQGNNSWKSNFDPDERFVDELRVYKHKKQGIKAVDMMLDMKNKDGKINISSRQLERLINRVPDIIKKMSSDKRVYFDMLMDGKVDIKNNKTFMNFAVAIMQGHLESHPEDVKIILDTFNEKSMPKDLLSACRYAQQRQGR